MATTTSPTQAALDWGAVIDEFRIRELHSLRRAVATVPGLDLDGVDGLFHNEHDQDWSAGTREVLATAYATAAASGMLASFSAYLYVLAQKRWEHTGVHEGIRRVTCAAARVLAESQPSVSAEEAGLVGLLSDLGASLASCMAAENALNCSCPTAMREHAARAAAAGRTAAEAAVCHLDGPFAGPAAFVIHVGRTQHAYFAATVAVAVAVEAFINDRPNCVPVLNQAIATGVAVEDDPILRGDVYKSELRSHRITLQDMVAVTNGPELRVDDGRIFYCYPFSVLGLSATKVTERLRALPRGSLLGRTRVVDTGPLDVTDVWTTTDPDGRTLGGVVIALADLAVTSTSGDELPPHHVEVRAMTLGTYDVRISSHLVAASEHELNQAMRRGTPHMGDEVVRQGPTAWARLAVYVDELMAALGAELADSDPSVRIVDSLPRRHHTVLSVRELSVVEGGRARPVRHYDEVVDTLGARLFGQGVRHSSAVFEEYVRASHLPGMVLTDVGFDGEVLIRNDESTIIVMPTTPNFTTKYYEELAEFTAALPAALDQWTMAIAEQRRGLSAQVPELDNVVWSEGRWKGRSGARVARDLRRLERAQSTLQRTVADAQALMAFVRSPALCQTARFRGHLDRLFEAAGIPAVERDLEAQVAQVDAVYVHVQTLAGRLEEREQRRYRRVVELILAVLACTSVADVFSLINGMSSAEPGRWVPYEMGAMMVLCIGAGIAVSLLYRKGRRLAGDG